MKAHLTTSIAAALALVPAAHAANIAAGKARVEQVCSACHGLEGISVADTIPNLGGQRERYIEAQLLNLKSGARQNSMMNNIASQLSRDDIANIAAYFSSMPGAGSATVSDFMPTISKTNVAFPANHRQTFPSPRLPQSSSPPNPPGKASGGWPGRATIAAWSSSSRTT